MSAGQIVGGIVALVAVVVVVAVIIIPLMSYSQSQNQNAEYCQQWNLQIEQQRAVPTGKWLPLDSEWNAFNQQVNEYNNQCAS